MPWNKIIFNLLLLGGIAFLFSSCHNRDEKEEKANETTVPAPVKKRSPENAELRLWFQNPNMIKWSQRMKQKDTAFSVSHFSKSKEEPLQEQEGKPYTEEEWQSFAPYFVFSPDHALAIDLYSYGNVPGKAVTDTTLEGGNPDSEVSLVHVKNKTKTRLLFVGPGTTFQQAAWIGDSVILITGVSDANADNEMKPFLWKIDLRDKTLNPYDYEKDSVHAQIP
jgi:hypothetical protein